LETRPDAKKAVKSFCWIYAALQSVLISNIYFSSVALNRYFTTNKKIPITFAEVVARRVIIIFSDKQKHKGFIPQLIRIKKTEIKKQTSSLYNLFA
jgi:hypothetical protein